VKDLLVGVINPVELLPPNKQVQELGTFVTFAPLQEGAVENVDLLRILGSGMSTSTGHRLLGLSPSRERDTLRTLQTGNKHLQRVCRINQSKGPYGYSNFHWILGIEVLQYSQFRSNASFHCARLLCPLDLSSIVHCE
jgi:hypothetical protein